MQIHDAYEECDGPHPLYVREQLTAIAADGREVQAWVYRYARPLAAARLIPGGDYVAHLRANALRNPSPR